MPDPLPALVDVRSTLLQQISELGDFQPGSITSATGAVAVPVAIAPNPTTPDTALIFNSLRKSMARRLHRICPLRHPSVRRRVKSLSSASFRP